MAINRSTRYPGRYIDPTPEQPQGAFKNRSAPEAFDGSYLERDWLNDWSGFFSSLLDEAGVIANGTVDEVGASQYFDALQQVAGGSAITTDTAVYVATTGDDVAGDGTVGAPFATPHRAMEYLNDFFISGNVVVTINCAAGQYLFDESLLLTHPQQSQIVLAGDPSGENTPLLANTNIDRAAAQAAYATGTQFVFSALGVGQDGDLGIIFRSSPFFLIDSGSYNISPTIRNILIMGDLVNTPRHLIYVLENSYLKVDAGTVAVDGCADFGIFLSSGANIECLSDFVISNTGGICNGNNSVVTMPLTHASNTSRGFRIVGGSAEIGDSKLYICNGVWVEANSSYVIGLNLTIDGATSGSVIAGFIARSSLVDFSNSTVTNNICNSISNSINASIFLANCTLNLNTISSTEDHFAQNSGSVINITGSTGSNLTSNAVGFGEILS